MGRRKRPATRGLLYFFAFCVVGAWIVVSFQAYIRQTIIDVKAESTAGKSKPSSTNPSSGIAAKPVFDDTKTTTRATNPPIISDTSHDDRCPIAVRGAVGVFRDNVDKEQRRGWEKTVLLTAANYGYLDILQNWEYLARKQDLQWAVLALDEDIYGALSKNEARPRVVPTDPGYAVRGEQSFRERGFNTLSCNKLRQVLLVLQECKVDVVFSDCDNIFFENPFTHDFGSLIQSRRYDYIYQPKRPVTKRRSHPCLSKGKIPGEGNTGFYFMSHTNIFYQQVIQETLAICSDPKNLVDDQTLFWVAFHRVGFGLPDQTSHDPSETITHCTAAEVDAVIGGLPSPVEAESTKTTARLCCLDVYDYPVGRDDPPANDHPVTFHANFCVGKEAKIEKLKRARIDGYGWNESRTSNS